MSTYAELTKKINELQKEAAELKKQERKGVIAEIRTKIAEFDLTATDLGLTGGKAVKGSKSVAAKYRNPETGETWSGRGLAPKWIKTAENSGKNRDAFLI